MQEARNCFLVYANPSNVIYVCLFYMLSCNYKYMIWCQAQLLDSGNNSLSNSESTKSYYFKLTNWKLLLQCDILLLPTTSNNNIYWGQFPLLLTHLSLCILEFLLFNKCGRHSCSVLHADCWCGLYGSKADVAVNGGHTAPNVFWNVSHTKPKKKFYWNPWNRRSQLVFKSNFSYFCLKQEQCTTTAGPCQITLASFYCQD